MNRTTMSPASAIVLVADWIRQHERLPTSKDFTHAHGLPHRVTLQYACHGWTLAVTLAQELIAMSSAVSSTASAIAAVDPPPRPCLCCDVLMPWQGPHIRVCERCRLRGSAPRSAGRDDGSLDDEDWEPIPFISWPQGRRRA